MSKIALIGAGNFGFALTAYLDRVHSGTHQIWLYDHKAETVAYLKQHQTHPRYYPTTKLSPAVQFTDDLNQLLGEADVLILAMVSTALEEVLTQLKPLIKKPLTIVSVMKALDDDTGAVLTQVIEDHLRDLPITVAVLAGGTTGKELVQEQYLGITLASKNLATATQLAPIFASDWLQVQPSTDLVGVQYASAFKNLISLVVGIAAGLGYSYGTQTHALSLVAAECEKLAVSLGAQATTFAFESQCWGNDMVMSATGNTRNRALGVLLGEGWQFEKAVANLQKQGKTAESVNTLQILSQITDLQNYPILNWLVELTQNKTDLLRIFQLLGEGK